MEPKATPRISGSHPRSSRRKEFIPFRPIFLSNVCLAGQTRLALDPPSPTQALTPVSALP